MKPFRSSGPLVPWEELAQARAFARESARASADGEMSVL